MRSKSGLLLLALLLAASATLAVYLYARGLEGEKVPATSASVEVLVAKKDIPANTDLNDLINEGAFETTSIPEDALVPGAFTELGDLQGQKNREAILAGEQIPEARITGAVTGGRLGIPQGFTGLAIPLEGPRFVSGELRDGDRVTVYGTFTKGGIDSATVVLVPEAQVLKVSGAPEGGPGTDDKATITLALLPPDAQKVVLAQEDGSIWLALLPPGQEGKQRPPLSVTGIGR
jgi:Flp pilus assembly protein CpaB